MALGFGSTAWTDFVGAWFVWMLTFIDLYGGGGPWTSHGAGTLLLLRLEREGEVGRGRGRKGGNRRRLKFLLKKRMTLIKNK